MQKLSIMHAKTRAEKLKALSTESVVSSAKQCILCSELAPLRKEVLLVGELHCMNVSERGIMSEHLCINCPDHVLLIHSLQG